MELNYDVVVAGGGPAGVCAAVSAARMGARTALVERFGCLGGNLTLGHVSPILGTVCPGTMAGEIRDMLRENHRDAPRTVSPRIGPEECIDHEEAKIALAKLCADAGVALLLCAPVIDAKMDGRRVTGLVIDTPKGQRTIRAKVVVDATGVKETICDALRKYALQDRWTFVGGHPMAGKEVGGFAHASADLFRNASMILTPYPSCGRKPLDLLDGFFRELGFGRVVFTTPAHHDRMIALTSQLAHVVSSAYVRDPLAPEHAGYSAGSFHDMTRVARLDPETWTDLFLANRSALLDVLNGLIDRLSEFKTALDTADADALRDLLAQGRAARLAASGE